MDTSLRLIATPYTAAVLRAQQVRGDLAPCRVDSSNRILWNVPSLIAQRESYVVERAEAQS